MRGVAGKSDEYKDTGTWWVEGVVSAASAGRGCRLRRFVSRSAWPVMRSDFSTQLATWSVRALSNGNHETEDHLFPGRKYLPESKVT